MSSQDGPPFEDALQELESVVGRLEDGGLGLDDAINLYEQGMKLAAQCQERLDKAELRISQLRQDYVREEPASYEVGNIEEDV